MDKLKAFCLSVVAMSFFSSSCYAVSLADMGIEATTFDDVTTVMGYIAPVVVGMAVTLFVVCSLLYVLKRAS